jgi:hypothetical protein
VAAIEAKQPIDWKGIQTPPCAEACVPETIAYTKPRQQRIVKIAGHPSTVYIRYMQDAGGIWKLSGMFEAHTWNHPPRHEVSIDPANGRRYLRIASQGVRGSGVDEEVESWFDLASDTFSPLLTIPVAAHHDPPGAAIGRRLHAYVAIHRNTIEVTYEIHFSRNEAAIGVGSYQAAYRQSAPGGRFRLTKVDPAMPLRDFESLLDFDAGPAPHRLQSMMQLGLR